MDIKYARVGKKISSLTAFQNNMKTYVYVKHFMIQLSVMNTIDLEFKSRTRYK